MQAPSEKASPERILRVAGRLFAERGFSNVSVREVCREASTTAPMIYYYFGNKRGLFDAVVNRRISMQAFIERLRTSAKGRDGRQAVSSFVETYLTSFPENAFDPGLYISASAKLDSESAERMSKQLDEVHRIVISILERGIRASEFRKTDPAKAADCLIGMLNRVIFQRIHFSKTRDLENTKSFIIDFFMHAMK